ncbi:CBS domain-containing protein [Deinococcus irradiatisoli]|uniref:CBS domain-containing protein n=1 Tax=Deinococcus irradiatisoli TaxID=2202254 RepID=A0A2Z3JL27_9DEIO|nr:CBS domain-containing protein [Deinococcus irradiatisoli]AWN24251.1 CBS domain-containing protein [Deinococcus irradiatisoli]
MAPLRTIMTRDLVTASKDATLKEVAALMADNDIGNVLFMDGERLAGILTDRDIVVRAVAFGRDPGSLAVDHASADPFTLDADTEIAEAAAQMGEKQIRRLPVTEGGKVVGIVSLSDLSNRTGGDADQQALEGISTPTL